VEFEENLPGKEVFLRGIIGITKMILKFILIARKERFEQIQRLIIKVR